VQDPDQLAEDVRNVDAFLNKYGGTKAAEGLESWRAQAGKVLEKWQAQDRKARAEPVKVPLAVLLSEFRKDKAATDAKYRRKWLVVAGKVTKLTRAPVYDLSADGWVKQYRSPSDPLPAPRADVVALTVKLQDRPGVDDAIECHCVIATRAGSGGVEVGQGLAAVKEGDTVTILGKWLSPFPPFLPRETFYGGDGLFVGKSCALDQCELAK
jgi:hypothetical protein